MINKEDSELIASVLTAWFEDEATGLMDLPQPKRWFKGGKALDEKLAMQFANAVSSASQGHYDHWQATTNGALALIVTLDQFNRNMHRGSARAFADDAKALGISQRAIANELHHALPLSQQVFLYLPFEHDETADSQEMSIRLFTQLHCEATPTMLSFARTALDSAIEHKQIIDRFGRYPHRNSILGRTNTDEEAQWLQSGRKSFGQG